MDRLGPGAVASHDCKVPVAAIGNPLPVRRERGGLILTVPPRQSLSARAVRVDEVDLVSARVEVVRLKHDARTGWRPIGVCRLSIHVHASCTTPVRLHRDDLVFSVESDPARIGGPALGFTQAALPRRSGAPTTSSTRGHVVARSSSEDGASPSPRDLRRPGSSRR